MLAPEEFIFVAPMSLQEAIANVDSINEYSVIYAKLINGEFDAGSEVVFLELTEQEIDLPTKDISEMKCPGYDYFLEISLIKELVEDFLSTESIIDIKKVVERVLHYKEYDA
jgi:hypothetical protein